MRTKILMALCLVGCASADGNNVGEEDPTGSTRQFLEWSPSQALVDEHVTFHEAACSTAGGPRCGHIGEDFLTFHRSFLSRLRDDYQRQGLTADVAPWYELPAEMKDPTKGWTPALEAAEHAILTLTNPATGQR